MSDVNFADKLEQNTAVYAPITFEVIVIMIKRVTGTNNDQLVMFYRFLYVRQDI